MVDDRSRPKWLWRTIDIRTVVADEVLRQRLAFLRAGPMLRIMWFSFAVMGLALPLQLLAPSSDVAEFFITAGVGVAVLALFSVYVIAVRPWLGPIVSIEALGGPGRELAAIAAIILSLAVLLAMFDPPSSHTGPLALVFGALFIIFGVGRLLTARAKRRLRADPSLARILAENAARTSRSPPTTRAAARVVAKTETQRANPHQNVAAGIRAGRSAIVLGGLCSIVGGLLIAVSRLNTDRFSDLLSALTNRYGATTLIGCVLAVIVVGVLMRALADQRQRKYEQQTAPSAQYAIQEDRRPAILLLRSFADDVAKNGGERFEETIAPLLMQYGPLVAIGDPRDDLPDLGAYRDYVDDAAWQERVRAYIGSAKFIVMIPGNSRWIRWELSQILGGDFLHKTILVFPPGEPLAEKSARLNNTWSSFMDRADLMPHQVTNLAETVAIHFFDSGSITCLVDRKIANARSYQYGAAMLAAFGGRVGM